MKRVLVVEDNPLNQKLLVTFLSRLGLKVEVANDTREADAALWSQPPSLVLLDVSLPGEDGLTWLRRTRAAGFAGPVVAVTAHAMPGDRDAAIVAGCNDYLAKPIALQSLRTVLGRFLA